MSFPKTFVIVEDVGGPDSRKTLAGPPGGLTLGRIQVIGADDRRHRIGTPRLDLLDPVVRGDAEALPLVGREELGGTRRDPDRDDATGVADGAGRVGLAGFELHWSGLLRCMQCGTTH